MSSHTASIHHSIPENASFEQLRRMSSEVAAERQHILARLSSAGPHESGEMTARLERLGHTQDILSQRMEALLVHMSNTGEAAAARASALRRAPQDDVAPYVTRIEHEHRRKGTIVGQVEDSRLVRRSSRYHYVAWFGLAIAVVAITLRAVLSGTPGTLGGAVIVVFCLLVVWAAARWIWSKV